MVGAAPGQTPYKGLMPYDESDAPFFFGREREAEFITANLTASRLTLLYGSSGVGKSSVLNAGVAHQMREQARREFSERGQAKTVISLFNSWRDEPIAGLRSQIGDDLEKVCGVRPEPSQQLSFAEFLNASTKQIGGKLLIVLDQFEEYFLYPQAEGEGSFAFEFVRAVNSTNSRVNFLISIREDWLAKLDRFKTEVPGLFDNYLRIERLDHNSALEAIERPVAKYNGQRAPDAPQILIAPGFSETVLGQLEKLANKNVLGDTGSGEAKDEAGTVVETRIQTPYLQLVMTRLWNEAVNGTHQLSPDMLEDPDRAETIIQSHLDEVMNNLADAEQDAAARVFNYLVTPSGTKITQASSDLARYAGLSEAALAPVLEKLTTKESGVLTQIAPAPGQRGLRYEIFHDVLAAPILNWCNRYNQKQAQEKAAHEAQMTAEAERLKAERLAAERQRELEQANALAKVESERAQAEAQRRIEHEAAEQRFRRISWVLGAVSIIVLLAMAYAVYSRNAAVKAKNDALKARNEALVAENDAVESRKSEIIQRQEAERQAELARERAEEANREREKTAKANEQALHNLALAKAATVTADARARDAKIAQTAAENARKTDSSYRAAFRLSRRKDKREEAIAEFKKAFDVYNASQNPADHVAAIDTLLNIGEVYADLGDENDATKFFKQALASHPVSTANLLSSIGDIYREIVPKTNSPFDQSRLAAWSPYALGFEPREKAVDYYQAAISEYEKQREQLALAARSPQRDDELRALTSDQAGVFVSLGSTKVGLASTKQNPQQQQDVLNEALKSIEKGVSQYGVAHDDRGRAYALFALAQAKAARGLPTLEVRQQLEEILQQSLAAYPATADQKWKIPVFRKLGEVSPDPKRALDAMEQVVILNRDDPPGKATALIELSNLINMQNIAPRPDEERESRVVALNLEAADLYEKADRLDKAAETLMSISTRYSYRPEFQDGVQLQKAANLYMRLGRPDRQVFVLSSLAYQFSRTDRPKASKYLDQMKALAEKMIKPEDKAQALENLGQGYVLIGELAKADTAAQDAIDIYTQAHDPTAAWSALQRMGTTYLRQSDASPSVDKAVTYFERARALFASAGLATGFRDESMTLTSLGEAYAKKGQKEKAIDFYELAAKAGRDRRDAYTEARALREIGSLYQSESNPDQAIAYLNRAVALIHHTPYDFEEGGILITLGALYVVKGELATAIDYYERAAQFYADKQNPSNQSDALMKISDVYLKKGEPKTAEEYKQRALKLIGPSSMQTPVP